MGSLIKKHQVFYEIWPYCVLFDSRPAGGNSVRKRVQAGFDVYLYAAGTTKPLRLAQRDEEFGMALADLERAAREIVPPPQGRCEIEVTPFASSVVFDTHRNLRPEAWLRIRITHDRGLNEPEGRAEEEVLSAIRKKLAELGVPEGRPSAGR